MRQEVYDIEVFPNFFCACFEEYDTGDTAYFEISPWRNDRDKLIAFIKLNYLIGYNNNGYDNIIINYILAKDRTNEELYEMSQLIINGTYDDIKMWKFSNWYRTIDIMTMLFSKMQRVSLKELAVTVKYPKIQDLPLPFDSDVSKEMVPEIRKYCFNDVGVTKYIAKLSAKKLDLRVKIEKEYNIKCLSKDDVNAGVALFERFYMIDSGSKSFRDKRTHRASIKLADCISDKVEFKSLEFNKLLKMFKSKVITETKGALSHSVIYGGVKHDYGTGGIHSKDRPAVIMADDDEIYMDADVGSLYPSLLILLGACPKHLNPDIFIPRYKAIRDERIVAKKEGNKLIADTYKLSLNGTYGNLINQYSWLYDPQAAMTITLNGQLMLSMLSEQFTDAGFKVDSLNTDGVTVIMKKKDLEKYYNICRAWEKHTGLELEYARYYKVVRTNVNNYLAWYADDEGGPLYNKDGTPYVKEKGAAFTTEPVMGKGYDKPVLKKALREYFVNGTPIEKTITEHDDIYDFCMMQKMDSKFKAVWKGDELQKTNRFYASSGSDAGYVYKKKLETGELGHVLKDSGVVIFNDYVKKDMKDYHINYQYYIAAARKIINKADNKQLELF